MNNRNQYPPPR